MNNIDKAKVYDECIRESDKLQRINSKLKSEYPINMPEHIQVQVDQNNLKISQLVQRLNNLFI
jgi:hypothetical protein